MDTAELQRRIEASPELKKLCAALNNSMCFHVDNSVQLDPFLVIAIIGIVINILIYCRDRTDEELKKDIRNIRALPARKLVRLRRQVNALWRNHYADGPGTMTQNPALAALYEIGEMADDEQLDAILALVKEA
jgi:hypothetical protein